VAGREPGAARGDLGDRLLAAGVEHDAGAAGEADAGLQEQRGLADAGRAAEQHDAAGDEAAAEDAVDLGDAAGAARLASRPGSGRRWRRPRRRRPAGRSPGAGGGELGLDGVPGVAARALAEPAGCDRAAGLADPAGRGSLGFAHQGGKGDPARTRAQACPSGQARARRLRRPAPRGAADGRRV
jgi:hypothetical protein